MVGIAGLICMDENLTFSQKLVAAGATVASIAAIFQFLWGD